MSSSHERLSVPRPRKSLPRPISESECDAFTRLADALCGPSERAEPPSRQDEFPTCLTLALAARSDSFETMTELASRAAEADATADPVGWLRRLSAEDPPRFELLSTVLAGAYLMVTAVREAIGYPGQRRDPAGLEEAADEISDGILDPVLERGHFFVPTPEGS